MHIPCSMHCRDNSEILLEDLDRSLARNLHFDTVNRNVIDHVLTQWALWMKTSDGKRA